MENIPVIDIGRLSDPHVLQQLDLACRDWGFFQVVNHGIDGALTDGRVAAGAALLRATAGDKAPHCAFRGKSRRGYFDEELTKNTLDWKEVFDYGPPHGDEEYPQWPDNPQGLRTMVVGYYDACEHLAFDLLAAISVNLGVPADFLFHAFEPRHTSFVRINYYPVCPQPERPQGLESPVQGHLGVNQHTDAGALTILLQDDQPGLEVLRDGTWHLVQAVPGALVINIGDIAQVWSNDRYRASLHRVARQRQT